MSDTSIEDRMEERIRAWAAERRLPSSVLERWLAHESTERAALLRLAQELRLRTGQFQSAFEMVEEIAVRDHTGLAAILDGDEVRRARSVTSSAQARARATLEALRALRFPRLKQAERALRERIAALSLPRAITIVLPRELASDEVRIELVARSGTELKRGIAALAQREDELARIVEALGGRDEL